VEKLVKEMVVEKLHRRWGRPTSYVNCKNKMPA
jgi:hypothetical protein